MNRPNAGQAAGLGAISIAAGGIAIGVAQIELGGQAQPHVWSNAWLLLAVGLAGTGLAVAVVFFVASMFADEEDKHRGFHVRELRASQGGETAGRGGDNAGLKATALSGLEVAAETGHPDTATTAAPTDDLIRGWFDTSRGSGMPFEPRTGRWHRPSAAGWMLRGLVPIVTLVLLALVLVWLTSR